MVTTKDEFEFGYSSNIREFCCLRQMSSEFECIQTIQTRPESAKNAIFCQIPFNFCCIIRHTYRTCCQIQNISRGFVRSLFEDLLNTLIPNCSFGRNPLILYSGFVVQNQWIITLSHCVAQTPANFRELAKQHFNSPNHDRK